jgi:hypothetical protein
MIETRENASVRCTCTVTLLSRVYRPFLFRATVIGEFPHDFTRQYTIAAPDDDAAAVCAMRQFVKEMSTPAVANGMVVEAEGARLQ